MYLIIAAFLLLDGAPASAGDFPSLVKRIMKQPDGTWPGTMANIIGRSGDLPMRELTVPEEQSTDGKEHAGVALLEKGEGGRLRPFAILLGTWDENRTTRRSLSMIYKVSPAGELLKAIICRGEIDINGEGLAGSAKDEELDIRSREVINDFQRELDFWLKGIGRKKKIKSKPTPVVGTPAQPAKAGPVANSR